MRQKAPVLIRNGASIQIWIICSPYLWLKGWRILMDGLFPSTKRTTGLPVGELVLWCGMFAPKGRLEWYHGLARGAPF